MLRKPIPRDPRPRKRSEKPNKELDTIALYLEWKAKILPALQQDLLKGITPEAMLKQYEAIALARIISLAATADKPGEALAAAKDIVDRARGKATEKKEVKHSLAEIPETELRAILQSEEEDLENMEAQLEQ
jgi:hypothetical protein